jgi:hypothetical protein
VVRAPPARSPHAIQQALVAQSNEPPLTAAAISYSSCALLRHPDLLTIGFVVVLLISNLVAQKTCQIGPFA